MVTDLEIFLVGLVVAIGAPMLALRGQDPRTASLPAPAPTEAPPSVDRALRGLVIALAVFPASAWLTLAFAFASSDRPLPVKPPGSPSDCGGSSGGDGLIWLLVIGSLLLLQLGPSAVAFLVGRRGAAVGQPVPHGRRFLQLGAALAAVALVGALGRLAMGGVAPAAFTTYGAVTPPGAKGWRAETVIRRQLAPGARWHVLGEGAPLARDTRRSGSHLSMGPHEVPGLKAWIEGAAVNIVYAGAGRFLEQAVTESTVDPARRPRFETPPQIARARGRNAWLLRARQRDGSWLAVRVTAHGVDGSVSLSGVGSREVGLLLRPQPWPLFAAIVLVLLAALCWLAVRRRGATPTPRDAGWAAAARLGAANLLLLAGLVLYGGYRIYC